MCDYLADNIYHIQRECHWRNSNWSRGIRPPTLHNFIPWQRCRSPMIHYHASPWTARWLHIFELYTRNAVRERPQACLVVSSIQVTAGCSEPMLQRTTSFDMPGHQNHPTGWSEISCSTVAVSDLLLHGRVIRRRDRQRSLVKAWS